MLIGSRSPHPVKDKGFVGNLLNRHRIKQRPGLVTVYGFMLNDALGYEDRIHMQVETVGLLLGDDVVQQENPVWSSTVYWYDERP